MNYEKSQTSQTPMYYIYKRLVEKLVEYLLYYFEGI